MVDECAKVPVGLAETLIEAVAVGKSSVPRHEAVDERSRREITRRATAHAVGHSSRPRGRERGILIHRAMRADIRRRSGVEPDGHAQRAK